MSDPFEPHPDGIRIELPEWLVEFLGDVPALLASIGAEEDDPADERLTVPVYLDDPDANRDWWHWMGSELEASKSADRSAFQEVIASSADGVVASEAESHAVLRVLTEARLVIAARSGVEVESDYERLPYDTAAVLNTLATLQEGLIEALSDTR